MTPDITDFLHYWERVHARTARLIPLVPEQQLEWRPSPQQFSFGDLLRHLAGSERFLFVEVATGGVNRYPGHGPELADGPQAVRAYYDRLHAEAVALVGGLSESDWTRKRRTPEGAAITTWKWLRAMLEHESHHRGQLYLMLGLLGAKTPPLFGLTSEEVLRRADAK